MSINADEKMSINADEKMSINTDEKMSINADEKMSIKPDEKLSINPSRYAINSVSFIDTKILMTPKEVESYINDVKKYVATEHGMKDCTVELKSAGWGVEFIAVTVTRNREIESNPVAFHELTMPKRSF
jgi:hypothetical protein